MARASDWPAVDPGGAPHPPHGAALLRPADTKMRWADYLSLLAGRADRRAGVHPYMHQTCLTCLFPELERDLVVAPPPPPPPPGGAAAAEGAEEEEAPGLPEAAAWLRPRLRTTNLWLNGGGTAAIDRCLCLPVSVCVWLCVCVCVCVCVGSLSLTLSESLAAFISSPSLRCAASTQ